MDIDETRWMMQWGDEGTLNCDHVYLDMVKLYCVLGIAVCVWLVL